MWSPCMCVMKIRVVSINDFFDRTACRVEPSPMSNNQFSAPIIVKALCDWVGGWIEETEMMLEFQKLFNAMLVMNNDNLSCNPTSFSQMLVTPRAPPLPKVLILIPT